jgi:DNA polymerase elongation subunit (family B)
MMLNMSPETLVREEQGQLNWVERLLNGEDIAADCRANGWAMAANGSAYRQDVTGVLPKGMRYVFDTRKAEKNRMLDLKREKEAFLANGGSEDSPEAYEFDNLIAAADATQGAMKVLANSGYGASANRAFRYFNLSIAEGITLTGQLGIQYIGNMMNKYLNRKFNTEKDYVITSDTDSAYVVLDNIPSDPQNIQQSVDEIDLFLEKEFTPFINAAYQKLSDRLGAKKNLMDMKREAIADVGIFRGKKNYVLRVWDNEHVRYHEPILKMTGIETALATEPDDVDEKPVEVAEAKIGWVEIVGDAELKSKQVSQYHLRLHYVDGKYEDVNADSWSCTNAAARVTENGNVTAPYATENATLILRAMYHDNKTNINLSAIPKTIKIV